MRWQSAACEATDATNHSYGLAFVLLAYAHATMAGVAEARPPIEEIYELMERRIWDAQCGLYADETTADWSQLQPYRGQNANMHFCEALLAAHEATSDLRYLRRAEMLARNITVRQAVLSDDLVWEHYHADWTPDFDYNRHDRSNIFWPWGFQPGHLAEWAKLLLLLKRQQAHLPESAMDFWPCAQALFDSAMEYA